MQGDFPFAYIISFEGGIKAMKKSVYLLEKDFQLVDGLNKRFLIETVLELKGVNGEASIAYGEIQSTKPDILVFGYPSNFTAEQLMTAMSSINPNMKYIAILEEGFEGKTPELRQLGLTNIIQKPCNADMVMDFIKSISGVGGIKENPFTSVPTNNPFQGSQMPLTSPFGSIEKMPSPMENMAMNNFSPNVEREDGSQPMQSFKTLRQNLIAIHCPKGGVGKTSISTNIAALLSTVKIGKQPLNVLLVDMDWEFGDVCVNMGQQPRPSVMNWINDIKSRRSMNDKSDMNFTQAQIDNYLIKYKTGLKILAAPPSHNDILDIPEDAPRIIIDNLKNNCNFDVIIFDCGNNTQNHSLQALMSANMVYEVITMDVSAMNDLSMLLSTLKSISFPLDKMKLIINKLPKTDKEFRIEDISSALGLEVVSVIQDNDKVRVHNNNGEPLVLSDTSNSFTNGIKNTANTMLGNNLFKQTKGGLSRSKSSGEGFLSRIFSR